MPGPLLLLLLPRRQLLSLCFRMTQKGRKKFCGQTRTIRIPVSRGSPAVAVTTRRDGGSEKKRGIREEVFSSWEEVQVVVLLVMAPDDDSGRPKGKIRTSRSPAAVVKQVRKE